MDTETLLDTALLAKKKRCVDLAIAACRKRQSPRTGFIHYFPGSDEALDTIPLYENFCFAAALYRQKTVEAASEAKDLIERLLAFQSEEGNFPVYLHEYPRCHNRMQGLKIAPILLQLMRHFSSIFSSELKKRLCSVIEKICEFSKDQAFGPWQFRYQTCMSSGLVEPFDWTYFSPSDWIEWLVSAQLGGGIEVPLTSLFHPELQIFLNPYSPQIQEGSQPKAQLIEYLLAEHLGHFSPRLLQDHPSQIHLAALWPISLSQESASQFENSFSDASRAALWTPQEETKSVDLLRIFWQGGDAVHSFVIPQPGYGDISLIGKNQWEILFSLPEEADQSQNDLFEVLFYGNYSPQIQWMVNGKKGTVFSLRDLIEMQSPACQLSLSFECIEGNGGFLGHFSQANRPSQTRLKNYVAYDWQIGIRTLRRTKSATLRVVCKLI